MPYDLNACGLVTICGLRVNHNEGSYFTCWQNSNETNIYTTAGASTTMYLNWVGGDVSIARNAMIAKNAGNVGIGTTTINSRLHVYQTGQPDVTCNLYATQILQTDSQANYQRIRFDRDSCPFWGIGVEGASSTNDLIISGLIGGKTSGTWSDNVFRIKNSDGNVVINGSDGNPLSNGGTFKNLVVYGGTGYGVLDLMTSATATNSTVGSFAGGTTGASNLRFAAAINIELDGTSTTNAVGRLTFYTATAGAAVERMRITSAGNVGINTTSPSTKLAVEGSATDVENVARFNNQVNCTTRVWLRNSSQSAYWGLSSTSTADPLATGMCAGAMTLGFGNAFPIQFWNGSTPSVKMTITSGGDVGIGTGGPSYKLHVNGTFYAAGSSIDYKEGICDYDTNSCLFMCLKPKTYQYKDEWKHLGKELKSETQIGLIAEEVAEVMPELAVLVNEDDNKVVRNVDYEKLSIVLLSEVQKLHKEIDQLKNIYTKQQ